MKEVNGIKVRWNENAECLSAGFHHFSFCIFDDNYARFEKVITPFARLRSFSSRDLYQLLLRYYTKTEKEVPWEAHGYDMSLVLHEVIGNEKHSEFMNKSSFSPKEIFSLLHKLKFGTWYEEENPPESPVFEVGDMVLCVDGDRDNLIHQKIYTVTRIEPKYQFLCFDGQMRNSGGWSPSRFKL